jgi:hypothetical protein
MVGVPSMILQEHIFIHFQGNYVSNLVIMVKELLIGEIFPSGRSYFEMGEKLLSYWDKNLFRSVERQYFEVGEKTSIILGEDDSSRWVKDNIWEWVKTYFEVGEKIFHLG